MEIFGGVRGGFARKGMDTQRDLGPYRESAGVNLFFCMVPSIYTLIWLHYFYKNGDKS